jgi:hypothetical protein
MRKTLLVGVVLVVVATLAVALSDVFDLEFDSVAVLGIGVGAVVALVPDRSPLMRLAGFAAGFLAAWIGYLVRAGLLPDSTGGRASGVALVIFLCVAVAVASIDRVPLWATLLGAAAMSGAYEYTYAAAPSEVVSTSMSSVTALLLTSAIGFLIVALVAPGTDEDSRPTWRRTRSTDEGDQHSLDDMMETAK